MTTTIAESTAHRIAPVPPGGPVAGRSVGVPVGAEGAVCLMTVATDGSTIRTAVRTTPLPEVPARVVAVGEDLAAEWDVDLERARWSLDRVEPVAVRSVTLELPTERDPVAAGAEIAAAGLVGELLWVPVDGEELWLSVDGLPHRVRSVDVGGRTGVVGRITANTALEVYAPAVRAGVDIVVLADCSGSMQVDDLPVDAESRWLRPSRDRWITRMEALKQSLREMLQMRMQISGRISRLALVEFNHETRQLFPRAGGMAQLDANSPPDQITDFRNGLAVMAPSGMTNIGNALHAAANLLYQHGHSGNDKLVVLVSDGADWAPKGDKDSGEMVFAVQEPVSLMAHLHRDMGIRLHAIGIGTAEMFRRRNAYPPDPAIVPNHTLLEELVKVGGGDPTTVGGLDVLEEYFSGLASGIVHRVRDRLAERRRPGPLPDATRKALARLGTSAPAGVDTGLAELSNQFLEVVGECTQRSIRVWGGPCWDSGRVTALCQSAMCRAPENVDALKQFLTRAATTLRPNTLADRASGVFGGWGLLLDRLASLANHDGELAVRFNQEFGVRADSSGAVQATVVERLTEELGEVRRTLDRMPDREQPTPSPGPTGFVYLD
jgi:Mg-chelatase subunit ChlD